MRIVLDTNVLVSALLTPAGPPASIVNAVITGAIAALVDNRILFEYEDVLHRSKFGFESGDIRSVLEFFRHECEYVAAVSTSSTFDDPADLPFYEVALSGKADYLVTGNTKHYPDEDWILSPTHFLRILFARE